MQVSTLKNDEKYYECMSLSNAKVIRDYEKLGTVNLKKFVINLTQ